MPFSFNRGWVRRFDSCILPSRKSKNAKLTMSSEVDLTAPIFKLYPIIHATLNVRVCVGVPKKFWGDGVWVGLYLINILDIVNSL